MASGDDISTGQRFSHLYLAQGESTSDDPRLRKRLAASFARLQLKVSSSYAMVLEEELGISIDSGYQGFVTDDFFVHKKERDILDGITIIWRNTPNHQRQGWRESVARIFREENACYRIDDRGGVHYTPDKEYERNRASTIAALASPRYEAVAAEFEKTQGALDRQPPDTKEAIRSTFLANEILFKLICPKSRRLASTFIDQHLWPIIEAIYSDNTADRDAARALCESFKLWVDAAHNYRHGQADKTPSAPPIELAVLMISAGAAFLRWLAEIDQSNGGE